MFMLEWCFITLQPLWAALSSFMQLCENDESREDEEPQVGGGFTCAHVYPVVPTPSDSVCVF